MWWWNTKSIRTKLLQFVSMVLPDLISQSAVDIRPMEIVMLRPTSMMRTKSQLSSWTDWRSQVEQRGNAATPVLRLDLSKVGSTYAKEGVPCLQLVTVIYLSPDGNVFSKYTLWLCNYVMAGEMAEHDVWAVTKHKVGELKCQSIYFVPNVSLTYEKWYSKLFKGGGWWL